MLPCFDDFLLQIESKARTFISPDTTSSSGVVGSIKIVNHSINLYVPQLNEGFPHSICGNIIAGIMAELNIVSKKYQFKIYPTVFKHPTDGRKDKDSDFVIIRIVNKRTVLSLN